MPALYPAVADILFLGHRLVPLLGKASLPNQLGRWRLNRSISFVMGKTGSGILCFKTRARASAGHLDLK